MLWRPSGHSLIASILFSLRLSRGVGREASKAQRVRRVRPQDVLLYGFLCACVFCFAVPFRTAGGRGYLAPGVELGKLEVCQRPLTVYRYAQGLLEVFLDLSGNI